MTIQTLKHHYYIIQKIRETEQLDHLLCREQELHFDVFRVKQRDLAVKLALIFTEQMGNAAFEDFYECFSKDGELYLAFRHHEAPSLEEKLQEEACPLPERILMGRKLFERILLLNMPDMLVYDVLDQKKIRVTPAGDVYFQFTLEDMEDFEEHTFLRGQERLADVLGAVFAREISLKIAPQISEYLKRVRQGAYQSHMECYQDYLQLVKGLTGEPEKLKPNTFLFRLWEGTKKAWRVVRPAFIALLVLVLAGYLLYSILHPVYDAEEYPYSQIGTLTIQEEE